MHVYGTRYTVHILVQTRIFFDKGVIESDRNFVFEMQMYTDLLLPEPVLLLPLPPGGLRLLRPPPRGNLRRNPVPLLVAAAEAIRGLRLAAMTDLKQLIIVLFGILSFRFCHHLLPPVPRLLLGEHVLVPGLSCFPK